MEDHDVALAELGQLLAAPYAVVAVGQVSKVGVEVHIRRDQVRR